VLSAQLSRFHGEFVQPLRVITDVFAPAACFEASLITGRLYLNFLGITKDRNDQLKVVQRVR